MPSHTTHHPNTKRKRKNAMLGERERKKKKKKERDQRLGQLDHFQIIRTYSI